VTTEANKQVVREFVDAINRQDWHRFEELVASDFVRHSNTYGQPPIRSRDQLRKFLAGEAGTFPDAHETVHFLVAEGDMVTVHSAFQGTARAAWAVSSVGQAIVRRLYQYLPGRKRTYRRSMGGVG